MATDTEKAPLAPLTAAIIKIAKSIAKAIETAATQKESADRVCALNAATLWHDHSNTTDGFTDDDFQTRVVTEVKEYLSGTTKSKAVTLSRAFTVVRDDKPACKVIAAEWQKGEYKTALQAAYKVARPPKKGNKGLTVAEIVNHFLGNPEDLQKVLDEYRRLQGVKEAEKAEEAKQNTPKLQKTA